MNATATVAFVLALLAVECRAADAPGIRTSCSEGLASEVVAPTFKVLSLNASHGRNTAINQMVVSEQQIYKNLDAIAELLTESAVDVVGLQEADAPSRWSGNFDHVAYLAAQTEHACVVHGLHSQSWISTYGAALLSRREFVYPRSVNFSPSPPSKQKGFVAAGVRWRTGDFEPLLVTVASVHFDFLSRKTRDSQVQEMVSGLSDIEGPLIVLGDLNSEWGEERSHVRALAAGLGLSAFEPASEALGTYKKRSGKRLDWILVSPELDFVDYRVLPDIVADHFAVYAELNYTRESQ